MLSDNENAALNTAIRYSADETARLPLIVSEAEAYANALARFEAERDAERARLRAEFDAQRARELESADAIDWHIRPTVPAPGLASVRRTECATEPCPCPVKLSGTYSIACAMQSTSAPRRTGACTG
jgi:hypothetical protein